jgi:plastocyanin
MKIQKTIGVIATLAIASTLAAAHAAKNVEADAVATVTGQALFDGKVPEAKPLTIAVDAAKGCCADDEKVNPTDMSLLIHKDGGLANVVLEITIKGQKPKVNEKPIVLDQSKCRFDPHVIVIPVGGEVSYLNSDTVSHNIHSFATKNEGVNKTVAGGKDMKQTFGKAETIKVKCDLHTWMTSYIVVSDATFTAISDAEGNFSFEGVPAGTHKVEYWHETLGKGKGEVVVNADGTSEPIKLKIGAKKKKGGRRR